MTAFLTALHALCCWQIAIIVVPCAVVIGFVLWAESRERRES